MTDTVLHIIGHVGTDVDYRRIGAGTDLSTFRLASTPRRWDKNQRQYVDGATNWITVQCWRDLALHVRDSLRRGDPVVVVGRLKTEEWTKDEIRHSRFVLDASTVGHDLTRGVSAFRRVPRPSESATDQSADVMPVIPQVEGDAAVLPDEPPSDPDLARAS